ncbi:hypothetical protein [Thermogemmatispora sp.]|uniref:hypothetical protein n=1 Tax=Thermogemmatispora sp. TaxID=1968838 RepID=UPI0035E4545B
MEFWICLAGGTRFASSQEPLRACPVRLDQRQYVGYEGLRWRTQAALQAHAPRSVFSLREQERPLASIGYQPAFASGQQALLWRDQSPKATFFAGTVFSFSLDEEGDE